MQRVTIRPPNVHWYHRVGVYFGRSEDPDAMSTSYSTDTVLRLTGLIYDAAIDRDKWVLFLDELGRTVEGHTLNLATIDASKLVAMNATARADPLFLHDYHEYYAGLDPWLLAGVQAGILRPGLLDIGERFVPPSALARTEFYSDLGRKHAVIGGISAIVSIDGVLTALSVSQYRFSQFGKAELDLFEQLLPHVRRALTVQQRIAAAETRATSAACVLDRIPNAVFFLSHVGRLILANQAGQELLRRRDGLAADHGELRASTPTETVSLRAAITAALQAVTCIVDGDRQVTTLARGAGRRPLGVVAIPVSPLGMQHVADDAAVAVIVTDPEQIHVPRVDTIRLMLGVTPGEALLVHCLAEGLTLKEAADRLGIELETVRKRLKVIFQKTDTHRQAELMRLALLCGLTQ